MLQLIIGLTAIVVAIGVAMHFGIRWQGRPLDHDPVEHEDDEP